MIARMTVTDIAAGIAAQLEKTERPLPSPATCRALRESARLSRRALAEVLGVTPQTIANYESGHRIPRGDRRAAYLEALRVLKESA
jgi:DNA-binding transcriptional regulator YiaG